MKWWQIVAAVVAAIVGLQILGLLVAGLIYGVAWILDEFGAHSRAKAARIKAQQFEAATA